MIHSVTVDYGGSFTKVLAEDAGGRAVRTLKLPSPPLPRLHLILRQILRRWRAQNLPLLTIGAKSIWSKKERLWLHRQVKNLAARAVVMSDVELAYEKAFGNRPGILILAGTGSISLGRTANGKFVRAGGHGPRAGDEGSGHWIGKKFLKYAGKSAAKKSVKAIASFAKQVIREAEKGDPASRLIVQASQKHLKDLVLAVRKKMRPLVGVPVRTAGGLFESGYFKKKFLGSL